MENLISTRSRLSLRLTFEHFIFDSLVLRANQKGSARDDGHLFVNDYHCCRQPILFFQRDILLVLQKVSFVRGTKAF